MDQVRAVVNLLWTQRFWVLSLLCLIVGVVCWNMGASDVQKQFSSRQSEIDSAFQSVTNIKNEPIHPNDDVNNGDEQQAKQQAQYVLKVWQDLYERQRTEVLYWPKSIGAQFVKHMEKRKFGADISSEMRGFYLNYIETRFDDLLAIVDAQKTSERGAAGRGGMGGEYGGEYGGASMAGAEVEAEDYLVRWEDQAKLQQKLLFKAKPSSMQVWVTQEDLWVYETLLGVIDRTNKARGATRPDNTAVRSIVALQVGNEVPPGKSIGQVYIPQSAEGAAGGEMGGEYGGGYGGEYGGEYGGGGGGEYGGGGGEYGGGMGGEYGGGMGGGMGGEYGDRGGMGGMGGGADGAGLVTNRYLDAEGNRDPGTSDSFGTPEFRQLPVNMMLVMDQRWIPHVLIECANAPLPIEVKQLRVNPSQSGSGFGRSGGSNRSRSMTGLAPDANLAEVEIRGVVYIYKEPNTEELAIPADDANALADAGNP